MNNYEYPEGADNKRAPWNQNENKPVGVKVLVSVTMSKACDIVTKDYQHEKAGNTDFYDFTDSTLIKDVEEQITLPQEIFKDWQVDDFEVVLN